MTDTVSHGAGRVSIEAGVHDLYKELSEGNNPLSSPFRTMKDIFMLAACVGFQRSERQPLASGKRQIFHYTQFSEQIDIPILKAIAIASTNDIQVLANMDQVVEIAEEFANAGIGYLKTQVVEQPGQPIWNLVEAIRS
jgi:dnd system-associated protein 4